MTTRKNGTSQQTDIPPNHAADDPAGAAYTMWWDFYRQMAEEGQDMWRKSMDMAQQMTPFFPNSDMFRQWNGMMQDMMGGGAGESPFLNPSSGTETYRQMYDTWLSMWTETMERSMRTPEFAAKSGKDMERFSEAHQKMSESMESYWQALRLPSAQDMREIYQKLYMIERKLDEMDQRIRRMQPPTVAEGAATPTAASGGKKAAK
jgi:hypothetical protein